MQSQGKDAGEIQPRQESMFYLHFLSLQMFWFIRDDLAAQVSALSANPPAVFLPTALLTPLVPRANASSSFMPVLHLPLGIEQPLSLWSHLQRGIDPSPFEGSSLPSAALVTCQWKGRDEPSKGEGSIPRCSLYKDGVKLYIRPTTIALEFEAPVTLLLMKPKKFTASCMTFSSVRYLKLSCMYESFQMGRLSPNYRFSSVAVSPPSFLAQSARMSVSCMRQTDARCRLLIGAHRTCFACGFVVLIE